VRARSIVVGCGGGSALGIEVFSVRGPDFGPR